MGQKVSPHGLRVESTRNGAQSGMLTRKVLLTF